MIFEALPVLGALLMHAVAHDRFILVVPVAAALGVAALRGITVRQTPGRLLIAGAVGAAATFLFAAPPPGPIPPPLLSPLCGALLGMSALCVLARNVLYAWICAGLLALLSLNAPPSTPLYLALAALGVCTLAAVAAQGRAPIAPFLGNAALVALGTFGLTQLGLSSEQWVTEAVYRLAQSRSGVGMTGAISLRSRSSVERSMAPLFEVKAEGQDLHLRTAVFDLFDGSSWSSSAELEHARLDPALLPEPTGEMELTPIEPLGDVAPAPAGARGAGLSLRGGFILRGTISGTTVLQTGDGLPRESPPPAALTALPKELRAQLAPWARKLGGSPSAIEAALRDGYEYSLHTDLSSRDKRHPLLVLLEEKRPAYCIYFAGAMAALLRSEGVPARVVGGFVAAERNPLSSARVVRARDAHAWVEAYDGGRWTAFDPTPWRSRDQALGIERKPGFFSAALQLVALALRRAVRAPGETLLRLARAPATLLIAAAVALWFLRRRWRGRTKRQLATTAALAPIDPRLVAAHKSYLKALRLQARPSETDDELVERLRAARGESAAQAAARFLEVYRPARYRGAPLDQAALDRALRDLN
jgi:hypothetical protein